MRSRRAGRAAAEVVLRQHLHELRADAQRRVEGRGRVLRHVGDEAAAQPPQLVALEREHVDVADAHRAAADARAAPGVAEQRQAGGRLAGAGLADEAEHLAAAEPQVDVVDDVGAAALDLDAQALDDAGPAR